MNTLFQSSRTASERRLRERVFNALPSASFQMDRLLQLLDVVESERSPTACIECSAQPRLHLNPHFVAKHCRQDEELFLLVLHELYHVVLGHTRLFPRLTPLHNIVFDAVINAMICQQFPDPRYTQFFQRLNSWDSFPARLLRPPPGWPNAAEPLPADASEAEQRAMQLLYGKDTSAVTYLDVFNTLAKSLPKGAGEANTPTGEANNPTGEANNPTGEAVLLGDHSGKNLEGESDGETVNDEALRQVFRKIVEGWPPPPKAIAGRDEGRSPQDFFLSNGGTPQQVFQAALRRLLRRAGILNPASACQPRSWRHTVTEREQATVLPQLRDRRAAAMERVLGVKPLFYQGFIHQARRVLTPQEVAHVYLDISGSMTAVLPMLGAALDGPHRRGEARLYAFSTVVDSVNPRRPLTKQPLKNTGGTDINCVLNHLVALKPKVTPRRVLLITDGYTGIPKIELVNELKRRCVSLFVGLVGGNTSGELRPFAKHVETLPWT